MEGSTETIYPGEGENLRIQKLGEFTRAFKQHKSSNPGAVVRVSAYMDSTARWTNASMRERQSAVRDILIRQGISPNAIEMENPQHSSNLSGLVRVTFYALPVVGPVPLPPPPLAPRGLPGSPASEGDSFEVKSGVVFDPAEGIQTEVEIAVRDAKGNRKLLAPFKFTLTVGADGLEEVGTELTLQKKKLKNQLFWGAIRDVEFKVKFDASVKFEKEAGRETLKEWVVKFKAGLWAELGIPSTKIRVPVAAWVYVDVTGHVGAGAEVTLFEF